MTLKKHYVAFLRKQSFVSESRYLSIFKEQINDDLKKARNVMIRLNSLNHPIDPAIEPTFFTPKTLNLYLFFVASSSSSFVHEEFSKQETERKEL